MSRTRTPASSEEARVVRVAGPLVGVEGLIGARLYEVVRVGPLGLVGEVIRLQGPLTVLQTYEETAGLKVGDPVHSTGAPLMVELGPGLLGGIFDGIQRPLTVSAANSPRIERGVDLPALDRDRAWQFEPAVAEGERLGPGDMVGEVAETSAIAHRVLVPAGRGGRVTGLSSGPVRIDEPVVWLDDRPLSLLRRWPVRERRPVARLLDPNTPLITGQRAIDVLFPLARGGSAAIPGGFGTGKTVQEHTLARWARADVIVYVACGERGNELTELLDEFGHVVDPRTGALLMERATFVANTSNMPIAAREASIYTGITLAEYYRDQGYDVALMADSTSRWGEALREVSSRLEEMPGEEGYPAYLPARLAEFYERAGTAVCLGRDSRQGSVSVIAAVSPPGGDFSEPMTQHSLRLAGTFWALDTDLARRRHFPAINWNRSFSLYDLVSWFDTKVASDWGEQRTWALALLQEETELLSIVQLLGVDALGPVQRVVLHTGQLIREDFLQQGAFHPVDAFCPPTKQYWMLKVIRAAHAGAAAAVRGGVSPDDVVRLELWSAVAQMREWPPEEAPEKGAGLIEALEAAIRVLEKKGAEP